MNLEEALSKYPHSSTFIFGDSSALCQRLLSLVRSGKKTATCEALNTYEREKIALPKAGDIEIALAWEGSPALILRLVSVEIVKFCEVSEEFALAEGENETIEGWRSDHQSYFERNGGFDSNMLLVCQRFHVVEELLEK